MKKWLCLLLFFPCFGFAQNTDNNPGEAHPQFSIGIPICVRFSDSYCTNKRPGDKCYKDYPGQQDQVCSPQGDEDITGIVSCKCQ